MALGPWECNFSSTQIIGVHSFSVCVVLGKGYEGSAMAAGLLFSVASPGPAAGNQSRQVLWP